jgi:hypothetical protein
VDLDLLTLFIGIAIIILASGAVKYWMPTMAGADARRHALLMQAARRGQIGPPEQYQASSQISAKALETYERLAKDKLEVIKTALAMGYKDDELAALDARLERLVGADKLSEILRGSGPETLASADLVDTQLDHEIERLRKMRAK